MRDLDNEDTAAYGTLSFDAYRSGVRDSGGEFVRHLGGLTAQMPVPACPEWTVDDLVRHLGRVHEMVRQVIEVGGPPSPESWEHPPESAGLTELTAWYVGRLSAMMSALDGFDPMDPCWTHDPVFGRVGYWWRRQAHEIAMHVVDLRLAAGMAGTYHPGLVADGIDEVLGTWRRVLTGRLGQPPDVPQPVLVACADRPERWLLTPDGDGVRVSGPSPNDELAGQRESDAAGPADPTGPTGAPVAAEVRGPADALLCTLWGRRETSGDGVRVGGEAAKRFLASTLTP